MKFHLSPLLKGNNTRSGAEKAEAAERLRILGDVLEKVQSLFAGKAQHTSASKGCHCRVEKASDVIRLLNACYFWNKEDPRHYRRVSSYCLSQKMCNVRKPL